MSRLSTLPVRRVLSACRAGVMGSTRALQVSERVTLTDEPCIAKSKQMMLGVEGSVSLAQGVVHWTPPDEALQSVNAVVATSQAHSYGPSEGLPELRYALKQKLEKENGLTGYDVMVTAGANQAFVNIVLSLTDASDGVVLFKPYYFNHLMCCQMTGGARSVIYGEYDADTLKPDLDWLERTCESSFPPKMVVLVNPSNPAGYVLSAAELERAQATCAKAGTWLVIDDTYEHFTYGGAEHSCIAAPNVIHIFSFSKAYGMMGWRMGYIAFPDDSKVPGLGAEILKVQDTIPICATQVSQVLALEVLKTGREWVLSRVSQLEENRKMVLDALSVLGPDAVRNTDASIYFFVKLPESVDDVDVVQRLITDYKVVTIPGSSCGCPGYFRIAYANCLPEQCAEACQRLKEGLQRLVVDANGA